LLKPIRLDRTELAPTIAENAPFLPGLSPVSGKPVHLAFDGGWLTSDAGVLVLAEIERKLRIVERLARCIPEHTRSHAAITPPPAPKRLGRPRKKGAAHAVTRLIADPKRGIFVRHFWGIFIRQSQMAGVDANNATKYWEEVVGRMEDMAARSILLPTDAPYLEAARENLDASRQ